MSAASLHDCCSWFENYKSLSLMFGDILPIKFVVCQSDCFAATITYAGSSKRAGEEVWYCNMMLKR
jgi:hypothetical protein